MKNSNAHPEIVIMIVIIVITLTQSEVGERMASTRSIRGTAFVSGGRGGGRKTILFWGSVDSNPGLHTAAAR